MFCTSINKRDLLCIAKNRCNWHAQHACSARLQLPTQRDKNLADPRQRDCCGKSAPIYFICFIIKIRLFFIIFCCFFVGVSFFFRCCYEVEVDEKETLRKEYFDSHFSHSN